MTKIIVGVIGEPGGGKGTFADVVEEALPRKKILKIKTSDIIRKTLELWYLPVIRTNFTLLANLMEEKFGAGTKAKALLKMIEASDADVVILEGFRWWAEIEMLRKLPNNLLVYVTANPEVRFARVRKRKERTNESTITLADFIKEEKELITEKYIPEWGKQADVKIENSGSLPQFKNQIKKFIKVELSKPS